MTSAGYAAPLSLSDAVALLTANPSARVLAGGSGLLVGPSRAGIASSMLVDLRKVPGLSSIEPAGDGLNIGAMTTLRVLAASDAVRNSYPALAAAVLLSGDAQTRNRATVGGPQPAEMDRMLREANERVSRQDAWIKARQQHIRTSLEKLDADFDRLGAAAGVR